MSSSTPTTTFLLPPSSTSRSRRCQTAFEVEKSDQNLRVETPHVVKRPIKTALHQAVTDGRLHQARLLSARSSDINFQDNNGWTPLMLACSLENDTTGSKILSLLAARGAKINCKDRMGRTGLMIACLSGNKRTIEKLLEDTDLELSVQDNDGNTALILSAMKPDSTILHMILVEMMRQRITVDTRNSLGYTALLIACRSGHFESALSLLTFGKACCYLRDREYRLNAREWIHWYLRRKTAEKLMNNRFPHLASKEGSPAPPPQETSVVKLLSKIYRPMLLKPRPLFKSYETFAVKEVVPYLDVNEEGQKFALKELIGQITRRERDHEAELEKLYYHRMGQPQPVKPRVISTAKLRAHAYSGPKRPNPTITLKQLFQMYALNHQKPKKVACFV